LSDVIDSKKEKRKTEKEREMLALTARLPTDSHHR